MTNEELNVLLSNQIKKEDFIYKTYEDETYIYVFTKLKKLKGIDFDDRYAKVGGLGPIKVNKYTKEYKRISFFEIPSKLQKENYRKPTLNSIKEGIKKRQYINVNDMFNFLELSFKNNDESKFHLGKVLYEHKYDEKTLSAQIKEDDLTNKFILFLNDLNLKSKINDKGWLEITRVPYN